MHKKIHFISAPTLRAPGANRQRFFGNSPFFFFGEVVRAVLIPLSLFSVQVDFDKGSDNSGISGSHGSQKKVAVRKKRK